MPPLLNTLEKNLRTSHTGDYSSVPLNSWGALVTACITVFGGGGLVSSAQSTQDHGDARTDSYQQKQASTAGTK